MSKRDEILKIIDVAKAEIIQGDKAGPHKVVCLVILNVLEKDVRDAFDTINKPLLFKGL